jgi:hypothetical protein
MLCRVALVCLAPRAGALAGVECLDPHPGAGRLQAEAGLEYLGPCAGALKVCVTSHYLACRARAIACLDYPARHVGADECSAFALIFLVLEPWLVSSTLLRVPGTLFLVMEPSLALRILLLVLGRCMCIGLEESGDLTLVPGSVESSGYLRTLESYAWRHWFRELGQVVGEGRKSLPCRSARSARLQGSMPLRYRGRTPRIAAVIEYVRSWSRSKSLPCRSARSARLQGPLPLRYRGRTPRIAAVLEYVRSWSRRRS